MISEQSSFDDVKAFNFTTKPQMEWSGKSLGGPRKVARWLAHIDVDGTTADKTPFAQAVWILLPYRCVETRGEYPPHSLEVPPESARLPSFLAERGTKQGDPPSSIHFVAVNYIVATALRILDGQKGDLI